MGRLVDDNRWQEQICIASSESATHFLLSGGGRWQLATSHRRIIGHSNNSNRVETSTHLSFNPPFLQPSHLQLEILDTAAAHPWVRLESVDMVLCGIVNTRSSFNFESVRSLSSSQFSRALTGPDSTWHLTSASVSCTQCLSHTFCTLAIPFRPARTAYDHTWSAHTHTHARHGGVELRCEYTSSLWSVVALAEHW